MSTYDWNIEQLKKIALALGELLPDVTFVGGVLLRYWWISRLYLVYAKPMM